MRGYYFSSRAPRRGQALLLAVLIMIFAALLSASFIAVVSSNLNQTARQADKNRAFASATAGLNYITRQLAYSDAGERWFEANYSAATLASYNSNPLYYTSLDRAQGWAGSFAKFPDPNVPQGEGPLFLAKVERLPYVINTASPDPDKRDPNKAGMLKITIIGLSANDPTAYHTLIRYKGGFQQAPIAQNMRVVSNWDFKNGVVPVAQVAAYDVTTPAEPKITFTKFTGDFLTLARPFTVTVSNPRKGVAARAATVVNVAVNNTTTPPTYTLTLAQPVSPAPVAEERIELAANLGAPAGIDYDNNPNTPPTSLAPDLRFRLSDLLVGDTTPPADTNQLDSARINGGLIFSGDVSAVKLRDINTAFSTPQKAPGSIMTSGVIALDNTTTAPNVAIAQTDGSNTDTLQASSDSPSGIFVTAASPAKYQLVSDGWNALKGVPSANTSTRAVTNFQPPALDSRENLERYRGLTRFSKPANASDPATASLYGGGQGIYIDNTQDREKIYDATLTPPRLREMTQTEFVNMLLSQPVGAGAMPTNYMRTGAPLAPTDANASLEQQHLRGWVGPDEFRGRGVEIELGNDTAFINTSTDPLLSNPSGAVLTITRDSRDDGAANVYGPVATKVWRDASGALQTGVYRRRVAWPQNGVIFAEGNVHITGTATNAPRSLTVVSMNNIYIEGSLQLLPPAGPPANYRNRKILLMARKNVAMNPTRVLGRPDAQTTATGAQTVAVGAGATLAVADGLSFKTGDFIQASTIVPPVDPTPAQEIVLAQGYITSDPTSTQITFNATSGGAVPDGSLVRTPTSIVRAVPSPSTTPPRNILFTPVANGTDAIQRRLNLPDPLPAALLANLRLAFNHQANRVAALTVTVDNPPAATAPVLFSNKGVFIAPPATVAPYLNHAATVVAQGDKRIVGQHSPAVSTADNFPGTSSNPSSPTTPTTELEARDASRNLAAISVAMNGSSHTIPGPPPTIWNYQTFPTAGYSTLPFFYLAGVGNRLDFPYPTTPIPDERRPDVRTPLYGANPPYDVPGVPLATSVSVFANGAQTTLSNERWNTTVTPNRYDRTNQFGFSPTYIDTGDPNEDVLTGDQSFYQTDPIRSTVDSRQLGATLTAGSNSLFLRQSDGLLPLPVTVPPTNYPEYRLQGLKIENVALVASNDNIDTIAPAYTINVNAFVYAQTGSWFVIPSGLFDERLKTVPAGGTATTTFLDLDGDNTADAGEFILDGANGFPDLNRNGAVDDAERYAMARYSRYNYAINFTGAIAENQTALVNNVRNNTNVLLAAGGVAAWMNSWATFAKAAGSTAITNGRISYTFDPDVVTGRLEDDPSTPTINETDTGFRLPQTPELL